MKIEGTEENSDFTLPQRGHPPSFYWPANSRLAADGKMEIIYYLCITKQWGSCRGAPPPPLSEQTERERVRARAENLLIKNEIVKINFLDAKLT